MPSLPVKVYSNGEIRRFRLETGNEDGRFGFNRLMVKITHLYPDLQAGKFRLMWKDPDGDLVLLTSNADLKEAVANLPAQDPVLRLHLAETAAKENIPDGEEPNDQPGETEKDSESEDKPGKEQPLEQEGEKPKDTEPEPAQPEEEPSLHRHVVCDGCRGPVGGIRFKCLTCPDFDLCSGCIETVRHEEHPILRIPSPNDVTWVQAFVASQAFESMGEFFHPGHRRMSRRCPGGPGGRCGRLRGCHAGAQGPKEPEVNKPAAGEGKEEPSAPAEEEVVKKVTDAIEAVLNIFGVPVETSASAKQQTEGHGWRPGPGSNPKVEAALNYMLAMGYRDDGGCLRKLLQDKKGDVSAVIDLLHQM